MAHAKRALLLQRWLWPVLFAAGVFGSATSFWVARTVDETARARAESLFLRDAEDRAGEIVGAYAPPLRQLLTLQRLFHATGNVDRELFKRFAEPMIQPEGARLFSWAPEVRRDERARFEAQGRQLWGEEFAIRGDADNEEATAPSKERYFPVLYQLADLSNRQPLGYDVLTDVRRTAIDRAIETNAPVVISPVQALGTASADKPVAYFGVPVYRGTEAPAVRSERRDQVRGLLIMALDVREPFRSANRTAAENGLLAILRDYADRSRPIDRWGPVEAEKAARASGFSYKQNFELADRRLIIEIEAGPEWLKNNRSRDGRWILVAGLSLTLALLVFLFVTIRQGQHASASRFGKDKRLGKFWDVESLDNKFSMLIEQSPWSIVITGLDGRIEYVNSRFVEAMGFSREEIVGCSADVLTSDAENELIHEQVRESAKYGRSWRGELLTRRRDGTPVRERVTISPIRRRDGFITHFMAVRENISELSQVMSQLEDSESRFRGAMSVMIEGLMVISPDNTLVFANRAVEEILGESSENLEGKALDEIVTTFVTEDGSPCTLENFPSQRALRDGCEVRDTVLGVRSAGDSQLRWIEINTAPLHTSDDPRWGVVLTFSDVTERRRTEEELRLAYEAIKNSGEGILMTDAQHRILSVNPALESVTGYRADEILGKRPDFVSPVHHDGDLQATMDSALESAGYWQGEVWNRRVNGESYPGWLGISAVRDEDNRPKFYIYIFSDMTERKEAQRRIEFLAHHDPLTCLPNRLLLSDRAAQALVQAHRMQSRVALMFLDLDRFKTINDSLGHPVGDALLKEVVERLKGCVRESDTISRQGGDEFLVLLTDVRDGDAISRIAEKIHQRMAQPFTIGTQTLSTTFSIGIAIYPEDGDDFDTLLKKADTAMYHAKEAGRNSHRFFTEQMNRQVVEHLSLETNLRRALENNEFVLHYQPQLDLNEGKVIGVEALIRWNSPDGLISPARFIPVAESSGLIVPIGTWVLNEACRQARAWQDAGLPPLVMAVNLSAEQFKRPELVNTVINALVLSDLDTHWLELELTESILIQDAEATLATVRRLKTLGIKLSVDDFGTGYSSLAYLKRFAVDKLKIDQSFVRDLEADPEDAAIVRAIIQMALSLKLKTIAEGVESEELANLLRMFHCDEIQGYWYARPMPAAAMEAFLRERANVGQAVAAPVA